MLELPVVMDESMDNLATAKLPDPGLLVFYKNHEDRIIWIDYDIDERLLEISKLILRWNVEDKAAGIPVEERKPITIFIFTDGGDIDVTYNFIDVCRMSKTPIHTVGCKAYSAGFLLLLCGHKRYALSMGDSMLHQGSGQIGGTFDQIMGAADNYKRTIDKMKSFILERTNISEKTFKKYKDKDWYLTPEEQVEYGVVDEIITDLDQIL